MKDEIFAALTAQYIGWQSVVRNYNRRDATNFIFNVNWWLCLLIDTRKWHNFGSEKPLNYVEAGQKFQQSDSNLGSQSKWKNDYPSWQALLIAGRWAFTKFKFCSVFQKTKNRSKSWFTIQVKIEFFSSKISQNLGHKGVKLLSLW